MRPPIELFAPAGDWEGAGLRALRALLLLHGVVRVVPWLLIASEAAALGVAGRVALGVLAVVAAAGGVMRRYGRAAAALGAVVVLVQIAATFPDTEDQLYLEFSCLALFGLLAAGDSSDGPLLRSALCWMGVLVLFHCGLQKLLHGYSFGGEALLVALARRDSFARSLQWLLDPGEVQRFARLVPGVPGAGPFRTESIGFIAIANALWLLPLVFSSLILVRRSRVPAVLAGIVFVMVVAVLAREILAGLVLAQLLLLCLPGQWNYTLRWLFAAAYAAMAGGFAGLLALLFWRAWSGS